MSDSDEEYNPSVTKMTQHVSKPQPPQPQPAAGGTKRVFGLRSATGVSTVEASTNPLFAPSSASCASQQSSCTKETVSDSNPLVFVKHFAKTKNIFPITYGVAQVEADSSVSSSSTSASLLVQDDNSFSYRVQKPGGAIRCVAASGSILLAGTSSGSNTASANISCPLFAWDIREIARGAAVAAASSSTTKTRKGQSRTVEDEGEFRQEGRFLFRADLFERDRNGLKQQFPVTHLTFLPASSAASAYNSISFGSSASNIFAASAGGPTFKVAKVDKAGEAFAESPSGQSGSINPETFRGHCNSILSLTSTFSLNNKPEVVSAGADGTVRLWDLETMCERNVYCARHGGMVSEGINFAGRSMKVVGGASASSLIWSAGLDDGAVMFWDIRQKYRAGSPSLFIKGLPGNKLARAMEIPSPSAATAAASSSSSSPPPSLFATRTVDSICLYDLRKIGASSGNNSSTLLLPEIKNLPLASPGEAAPMIISNDFEANSKNIVTTFDSADASDDNFRDGVAVVSLITGQILHRQSIFTFPPHSPSHSHFHPQARLGSSCSAKPPVFAPPLIHDLFGISQTGFVGLACSDGVIRFAPVSATATEKQRSIYVGAGSGATVMRNEDNAWFARIPMMMNASTTTLSGARRDRQEKADDDEE